MREYETLFIINPDLDEEATKAVIEKFSSLLENEGGEVLKVDEWGKKRLAYEVNEISEGYYVLMTLKPNRMFPGASKGFKIDGNILRYIVVNLTKKLVRGCYLMLNRVILIGRLTHDQASLYWKRVAVSNFL